MLQWQRLKGKMFAKNWKFLQFYGMGIGMNWWREYSLCSFRENDSFNWVIEVGILMMKIFLLLFKVSSFFSSWFPTLDWYFDHLMFVGLVYIRGDVMGSYKACNFYSILHFISRLGMILFEFLFHFEVEPKILIFLYSIIGLLHH